MKHIPYIAATALFCCISATSCDEGRIYAGEESVSSDGTTAYVTSHIVNYDTWSDGYNLAVAAFSDGNEYALISKNIIPDEEGNVETELSGIPVSSSTVEICVIDRLRRRVATFHSTDCRNAGTTLTVTSGDIDADSYGVLQHDVFNTTCVQCHGATGFAAAGLELTEGKSLQNLMGITSTKNPEMKRIAPGDAESSLLFRILTTRESETWRYDHSVEVLDPITIDLLKSYIDNSL